MNSTETLEKRSEADSSAKPNRSRYDVNYILEKQKKKDDRFKEKVKNNAEGLRAKSNVLWNKIEVSRRRHMGQEGINED